MERMSFFDEFDELIYVCDLHTYELLYMNDRCQKLVHENKTSYQNKKCYKVLQGFDTPCSFCTNSRLSTDNVYVWEYKNPHLNRYFSLRDKIIDWNGREARLELALDITDFKEQMLQTESRMSSMIQSIPGGVCQVADDGEFTVLWHNDIFLQIIGYTKAQFENELNGKAGYILPSDREKALRTITAAKETRQAQTLEMHIRRRDGERRTLLTTISYAYLGENVPVFYSVGIDITDHERQLEENRKKLQAALDAARQASLAKSRFLSRMSHEIRTPLNAVIGMATIAARSLDNRKALQNCHSKIESAAKYLLSLINDVLDVSRIESGKLLLADQPFALPEFMYDIIDLFSATAEKKGLVFEVEAEPFEEERFHGDPLHLKQIFVNLLANAVKFTPAGGRVGFHVRRTGRAGDTATFAFSVSDTGIGMKPEFLERIFDTFEQETNDTTIRYGGSGLGLAISKYLVELMRGSIAVQSREGEGSQFTVTLPLAVDGADRQTTETGLPENLRILIADETPGGALAARLLEGTVLEATCTADGREALLRLGEAADRRAPYDALLLSSTLPDADALMEGLRDSRFASVRTALAGVHHAALEEAGRREGIDALIRKPFFRSELVRGLRGLFSTDAGGPDAAGPAFDFSGKRLMLVEDNELNMEIAYEMLRMCRFEIETAGNGEEAVALFRSSPAGHFDAILMDIFMPVMDGLAAAEAIRGLDREDAGTVPIIALSANVFEEDREKSEASGMNAHLAKPVDMDAMCRLLRRILAGSGSLA